MAKTQRDSQIAKLAGNGDKVDGRTAELMRKDGGLSRARAQQAAFRQLANETYTREGNG